MLEARKRTSSSSQRASERAIGNHARPRQTWIGQISKDLKSIRKAVDNLLLKYTIESEYLVMQTGMPGFLLVHNEKLSKSSALNSPESRNLPKEFYRNYRGSKVTPDPALNIAFLLILN